MMSEKVENLPTANKQIVQQVFDFLYSGMEDYADGRIEVAFGNNPTDNTPNAANNFVFTEIHKAVEFALEKNNTRRNVYIVGSLLDPNTIPFGRSSDNDFYASNVVWCDIDKDVDILALKEKYKHCPPSLVIITAKHPKMRIHLWWKLNEVITDVTTMREILAGLAENLGGDPAVKNPTSLMRLGGLINYQTPKKLNEGRVIEFVDVTVPKDAAVTSIEAMLAAYPAKDYTDIDKAYEHKPVAIGGEYKKVGLTGEVMVDGREGYMHTLLTACIANLAAKKGAWPTPQEVFDEAWPTYYNKVGSKTGKSLDQEGRGERAMRQKIASKLRAFQMGRVAGARTIEEVIATRPKETPILQPKPQPEAQFDPQTGEVSRLYYINAPDIVFEPDTQDFVQGTLTKGAMSVVYGESNCGKTFFMSDLAFHIVQGKEWNGKRVEKGNVLYVCMEGAFGLKNRITAYRKEYSVDLNGFLIMPCPIDFTAENDGDIEELLKLLEQAKNALGEISLIVIDTLARAVAGGDENSGQDMGALVRKSDVIRSYTGAHICFIHHSGKDKARGARGHSSLRAAVDTEIEISRMEGADYSNVKIAKQRDMERGEDSQFKLKMIELGKNRHGEAITSCVVEPYDLKNDMVERIEKRIKSGKTKTAYDALIECIDDKGAIKNNPDLPRVKVVSEEDFKAYLVKRGVLSENENSAKTQYSRIRIDLIENDLLLFRDGFMWAK